MIIDVTFFILLVTVTVFHFSCPCHFESVLGFWVPVWPVVAIGALLITGCYFRVLMSPTEIWMIFLVDQLSLLGPEWGTCTGEYKKSCLLLNLAKVVRMWDNIDCKMNKVMFSDVSVWLLVQIMIFFTSCIRKRWPSVQKCLHHSLTTLKVIPSGSVHFWGFGSMKLHSCCYIVYNFSLEIRYYNSIWPIIHPTSL